MTAGYPARGVFPAIPLLGETSFFTRGTTPELTSLLFLFDSCKGAAGSLASPELPEAARPGGQSTWQLNTEQEMSESDR